MPEQVYVNGRYMPRLSAYQHIEDRANQFADGIYEVVPVYHKRLIDEEGHMERLAFSLEEMKITLDMPLAVLRMLMRDLLRRNRISNGQLYLQVSRGVIARNHAIPIPQPKAGIYMVTRAMDFDNNTAIKNGISVMTIPDTRWARPDIKSVSLLPNILAKSDALAQGYQDVLFVDDAGKLREGSSNNFYAISKGKLYQYPADGSILAGITRMGVSSLAPQCGMQLVQQGFAQDDFANMDEAFITSSGIFIMPIINIDGKKVGDGTVGNYTRKLQGLYHDYMMSFPQNIEQW